MNFTKKYNKISIVIIYFQAAMLFSETTVLTYLSFLLVLWKFLDFSIFLKSSSLKEMSSIQSIKKSIA